MVDVSPPRFAPLLLLAAACNPPPLTGESEAASSTTVTSTSTSGPTLPTSTDGPSGTSSGDTALPTTGACVDGTAQCLAPDQRQVCQDGEWQTVTCPEGQGCDAAAGASCQPCTCTPGAAQGCVDPDNAATCDCFDLVPVPCVGDTKCADHDGDGDGDGACHPVLCTPDESGCASADATQQCDATGTTWKTTDCPATDMCDDDTGKCMPACSVVAKGESSVGCDFWAVDMPNIPPRNQYLFAVAVSNPSNKATAHIEIFDRNKDGQEQLVAVGTIKPREADVFNLAGTQSGTKGFYNEDAGFLSSGVARGRAFRISSDVPIIATQFNPVGGGAEAFSTDASLLLPSHTLGKSYWHMAWNAGFGAGSTLIVVVTADNTFLSITSTEDIAPGSGGLPALTAGQSKQLGPFNRYDYVQLTANMGRDLSGSRISATSDIAVFGGHACARVPGSFDTCDHMEEQIFPIDTWGEHFVAARAAQRDDEKMTWRILAAKNGTTVTFNPPVSLGAVVQLGAGKFTEFAADGDFAVSSNKDHPVLVTGYLHSCKDAQKQGDPSCPGDPSMVQVVPIEQWARDYVFLVDHSYTNNSVKLVRAAGENVSVGCGAVPSWKPITPGYESAVVTFNEAPCLPGTNSATGTAPFGIMVVGESELTSYAYPGGLQLRAINPQ